MDKIERLQQLIDESDNIVFFGGAGVSTESGIPDFRSVDGLYSQKFRYPPEEMLSHTFFVEQTADFYDFYRQKMICLEAKPNPAHLGLAELEKKGKLRAVITQNIDGLHQAAGSKRVLELHGSVLRNFCQRCGKPYGLDVILKCEGVPHCACGGVIKPDVVLYEEGLNSQTLQDAVQSIAAADVLIVGGTSLVVYPAAGLIRYYRGKKLVLINRAQTGYDSQACLLLDESIGKVFSQLKI